VLLLPPPLVVYGVIMVANRFNNKPWTLKPRSAAYPDAFTVRREGRREEEEEEGLVVVVVVVVGGGGGGGKEEEEGGGGEAVALISLVYHDE